MKIRLLLPIALLLLLGACRHKQAQPEMVYVDSATRQHFLFKPGSYWIYKDAVSGRVDSCYVMAIDSSLAHNDEYTRIYQSIFSYIMQRPIINPSSDSIAITIGLGEHALAIRYDVTNHLSDFGLKLEYPFKPGGMTIAPDSCVAVDIVSDTIFAGIRYTDVIRCFSGKYRVPGNYAWSYINDSVGIVQIHTYFNNIMAHKWELQRWNVVK